MAQQKNHTFANIFDKSSLDQIQERTKSLWRPLLSTNIINCQITKLYENYRYRYNLQN